MTTAGDLKDRATFQELVSVPDGGGGVEHSWTDRFTVWGQVMVGSVRERLEAGRLEASGIAVVRVRNSSQTRQVRSDWRVVIKGVPYQIRQEPDDPDRRNRWLDVMIERGVGT